MNESMLNHLFLPHDLSSSTAKDYLSQSNHQYEYKILECMNEFLESLDEKNELSILSLLKNCIQRWSIVQKIENCSIPNLQSTIQKLTSGDFLPLYFHAQNAAVLIEIDENPPNQSLISSWQVLLPTETITSSLEPHLSCFPTPTYRLPDESQLLSHVQCELLVDFMNNTIEYSKAHKASYVFNDIREIPIAHYVCQWWITQFKGIEKDDKIKISIPFKKKHRDQIRYNNSMFPFRRSGLWMTVKVVFHTILTKRLEKIGTIVYKLLITKFLTYFISTRQATMGSRQIPIEKKEKQKYSKLQLNANEQEIYQHSCMKLKAYLNKHDSNISLRQYSRTYAYDHWTSNGVVHDNDTLPTISTLTNHREDAIGIALTHIENWVQSCLEEWINRSLMSEKGYECFENLQSFYEDYQQAALNFYYSNNKSTDPIGYSRFILTSLTIICLMHKRLCEDKRFERLKLHAIRIPHILDLFELLILPNRDDMIRARNLYDYFREFNDKRYPDLISNIESTNAFGVYFVDQSQKMNETLQKIQDQVEQDRKDKIKEVNNS
ncbi:unnamed protein product [Rotaria sp. Silwood1]|nr:unnamed protein product [Rotaria sp. Silwood1]CAF4940919.1 unnamed protein product [Rotaria sp. Silwood1]